MSRILLLATLALTFATLACAQAPIHPKHAQHAMVVSMHELASRAGADAMRRGGNAIDAAVATGFALAVVHPQAGNIGGGGFMLVRFATGEEHFVDYREKAPTAATRNMYVEPPNSKNAGKIIPNASLIGYKAVAVPGSVAGMYYAHKKWGKLPWASLVAPAIKLAREGFALSWEDADDLRTAEGVDLDEFATSKRIFRRNGRFYKQGDILRQPELARTLARLARNPLEFYKGAMARELAAFIQKGGGLITAADLAAYEVKERRPVHGTYRGYDIISSPPPSSGGITLIETLNILEGYDLGALGDRSADAMHFTAEAYRRAFFDRAELLGDTDFTQVPTAQLLDKKYAAAWRASIDPQHATPSNTLKRPPFEGMDVNASLSLKSNRTPFTGREPEHTTHYSIVDAKGNAVAVTTTLNDSFGSRVTVDKLGFLLNNEMDDFTSAPGQPNLFGLLQSEGNAIQPGKRPLSAMAPTIVLKDGKLFLVVGARGGPRIITGVGQIIMGVIDYGLDVQEASIAARYHHQWMPDQILVEPFGFSADTLRILQQRGHKLAVQDYLSEVECIMVDPKSRELLGAPDIRSNAHAVGF
jgi:gamma-glutamyltranspeptidase/glutathione hydrolase